MASSGNKRSTSPSGRGATCYSDENLSPRIPIDKASDDDHTQEEMWDDVLLLMFMYSESHENHTNSGTTIPKKNPDTNISKSTSRPPKKYKRLAKMYAKDEGENLSLRIPDNKVLDDHHACPMTEDMCDAALHLMFLSNGGHENHNNSCSFMPEKDLNSKVSRRTSRSPKKCKSVAKMYANDDRKVVDSSYFQKGNDEVNEGDATSWYVESIRNTNAGLYSSIFSFLWVVRIALVTPASSEDSSKTKDIIRRVCDTFKDMHPLEMMVPLKDLVKAALKIFSSPNLPWHPLALFEKDTRKWMWTGPILSRVVDISSPETWGLCDESLNKLVETFTGWIIAKYCSFPSVILRLPNPPTISSIYQPTLEQRFKDKRYNRSTCTLLPRSDEAIAYFHKEEEFRYFIPKRAFEYSTANGKKSTVAPLRKCIKIRDHFILKHARPRGFNILCLVIDAAARLPDGVGTLSDICSLARESQYIEVEDVSDKQLKQVVSETLDFLHYDLDPCVTYNKDTYLWTYMYVEREEFNKEREINYCTFLF